MTIQHHASLDSAGEGEQRYRALFEQSPLPMLRYDTALRVTDANAAAVAVAGMLPHEFVGLDLTQTRDARPLAALRAALEGQSASYEGPYDAGTGRVLWIQLRTAPLRDARGLLVGGIAIGIGIGVDRGEGATAPSERALTVVLGASEPPRARTRAEQEACGTETVLVVEDEMLVRRTVRRMLERRGYKVLEAMDGEDALRVCEEANGEIALVLTDVMMPRMGGRELVDGLRERFPRVRALFMSGHDERSISKAGVPVSHVFLIEKPFTSALLSTRVREALDAGRDERLFNQRIAR